MKILIYTNPTNKSAKTKLHRLLYGYTDYSNNNKYKYERQGLIQKKGIKKIARNTLLISDDDEIKKEIEKHGGSTIIKLLQE